MSVSVLCDLTRPMSCGFVLGVCAQVAAAQLLLCNEASWCSLWPYVSRVLSRGHGVALEG